MGKNNGLEKVGEDLKEVGEDLAEFARQEKDKITGHDPHDDVKKALSHEDKLEDFEVSTGLTDDGALKIRRLACDSGGICVACVIDWY